MTFYERFEQLCNEAGFKPQSKEMQQVTGVSSPAISNWGLKGAIPKGDVICRLAEYFHVSTDYLLGLSKVRFSQDELSEEELLLLNAYRTASVQGRFRIIQVCMNEKDAKGETIIAG